MAKCDVWMPLYIGDYLSNTSRLTTEQHGAYMLLIMDYWVNGRIPDDDQSLANITRLPMDRWLGIKSAISKYFTISNGEWVQERIEAEKEKAEYLSKVRAVAGSKGGSKTQANITANINHSLTPSPSPSPSELPSEESVAGKPPPRPKFQKPSKRKKLSNNVIDSQLQSAMSTHTDTDTDTKKDIGHFDLFWSLYPRKVKRKESQKVWSSRKLDSHVETITADIKNRIKNHKQWVEGFIPHPTTYLRGELWNDAIEPAGRQAVDPFKGAQ